MANSANQPISAKKGGMAVPIRSALKRTPVRDFNSFSIKVYYILISTTYQKNGDLFYSLLFLDFRTVCLSFVCDKRCGTESTMECFMYTFRSFFFSNIYENSGKGGFYSEGTDALVISSDRKTLLTSESKKPKQIAVVIHYCELSRFF